MFIRDLPSPRARPRSLILTSRLHRSLIFSQSSNDCEQRALRETAGTTLFSLPPLSSLKVRAALDFPITAWGRLRANQRTGRRTRSCTTRRLVPNVTQTYVNKKKHTNVGSVHHCYIDNMAKVSVHCGRVPNHTIIITVNSIQSVSGYHYPTGGMSQSTLGPLYRQRKHIHFQHLIISPLHVSQITPKSVHCGHVPKHTKISPLWMCPKLNSIHYVGSITNIAV